MDTLPRLFFAARFLLLCFVALLVPGVAGAQQVLSVSPNPSTPISVTATAGTNAASQTVRISNSGRGALKWTVAQPAASWLSVSPTSGVNNGTLTLTFSTSGLAVSSTPYQTTFTINSNGGSATFTVKVTIVAAVPALVANCPANITVASPDGNAVVVTYSIPTPSGGTSPYTTSGSPSSGSPFPVGTTTVTVTAKDSSQPQQTATCPFTVTVTYSPPSALIANCPANITVASPDGNPVVVTYSIPTPSGGTSPYTTSGSPSSGSPFPVGTTTVTVTAKDSSQPQQTATCPFTVTVTYSTPTTGVGPQATIQCPATNIYVPVNTTVAYVQSLIDANPGATTFCFQAGTHYFNASLTPKTGNTFIGEYATGPAILDGTGWTTTDDSQAAFRVYDDPNDPNDPNTPIDDVTIKNLVIRNMPQYGIHGSHTRSANNWTITNNEVASNKFGVMFTSNSHIQNNYIHHNVGDPTSPTPGLRGGAYVGQYADNTILDGNEIAYNGPEQKVGLSINVTFSNNFVHHNLGDGIWYDLNNNTFPLRAPLAAIIQGNRIEDNQHNGIVFEISIGATISNNTFRRNGEDGVLITVSQNAEIYNNVLDGNFGGIEYFLNCGSIAEGFDLQNNATHDNTVTMTQAVSDNFGYMNGFSHLSQCTSTQLAPYVNGQKNLTFDHNTYHVPSLSYTRYFLWDGWKDWTMWTTTLGPGHDNDPTKPGSIVAP
jgi:parallel beta-helix repeat protein